MKIWIVEQNGHLTFYTYSLCWGLMNQGHDVTLITRGNYEWTSQGKDRIKILELFSRLSMKTIKRSDFLKKHKPFRMLLKGLEYPFGYLLFFIHYFKEKPDIIHFQWSNIILFDAVIFRILHIFKIPFVYTVHNIIPHQQKWHHQLTYNFLYKQIPYFIVHSQLNKKELSEKFRIIFERIEVIPHGNFNTFIKHPEMTQMESRNSLRLPHAEYIILFFGAILKYKGLIYLIRAFSQIHQQIKAKLLIVGKPVEGYQECENEIKKLGLTDKIITRLEFVSNDDLELYFNSSDIVVLPYVEISQSGVVFTAFSFGKPVIATTVGSLPETILPGVNGHLVPPQNSDELGRVILKCLENPQHLVEMSRQTKDISNREYNWIRIAGRTKTFYQTVIQRTV